jgi:serine/threonine protein kinase
MTQDKKQQKVLQHHEGEPQGEAAHTELYLNSKYSETPGFKREKAIELAPGSSLGKYHILRKLGEGGMGEVYLAHDPLLQRNVAIKLLKKTSGLNRDDLDSFFGEARAVARLNHPNVISIHEINVANDMYFIAMEYAGQGSVSELIRKRKPGWFETLGMIAQAADGLAAAHAAGLIHRDIKPENLMLADDGVIKIADFGLSSSLLQDPEEVFKNSANQVIVGTPQYMSPEQFDGYNITPRSDIYNLGATLYALLCRKFPYPDAKTVMEHMIAHTTKPVPDPSLLVPEIPRDVCEIVRRCMSKDPALRFPNAQSLAKSIRDIMKYHELAGTKGASYESSGEIKNLALLVEPSKLVGSMILDSISHEGLDTRLATSAKQGLELAVMSVPQLVFADYTLPEMTGVEFLKKLKKTPITEKTYGVLVSASKSLVDVLKEDNEYAGGIVNKKSIKTIFPIVLRLIVNYAPLGYMEKMGKINRKVCFTGPFADELIGLGQTQAALKSFGRDSVLGDGSDSLLEIRTIPEATSNLIGISKELSQKHLNEHAALILVSKVHGIWKVLGLRFDGFQGLLHRDLDMEYWSCLLTAL